MVNIEDVFQSKDENSISIFQKCSSKVLKVNFIFGIRCPIGYLD